MKKLRQNQEFDMSCKLSPGAPVWTKWHQERANNNHMGQDLRNAQNKRYVQLIKDIVEDQH